MTEEQSRRRLSYCLTSDRKGASHVCFLPLNGNELISVDERQSFGFLPVGSENFPIDMCDLPILRAKKKKKKSWFSIKLVHPKYIHSIVFNVKMLAMHLGQAAMKCAWSAKNTSCDIDPFPKNEFIYSQCPNLQTQNFKWILNAQ